MMSERSRPGSGFCLPAAVLLLGLAGSCSQPATDPKADLAASLQGADVEGYHFALSEDEAQTTSSLTNGTVRGLITLGRDDADLPLRYTKIEDKQAKTAKTYRSQIVKKGPSLSLVVSEVGTDTVVETKAFPPAGPACQPEGQFDSLEACIARFNCTSKGALLCEANRTCEPQFAALTCCLKNGQIFSVHLIYPPTSIRCQLRELVPDLEGLVLSPG